MATSAKYRPDPMLHARPWRGYAGAVAAVAGTLLLRYLLNPVLGHQGPYLLLTLAIVLAALYGGFGPAVAATVLGALVGTYLFIGASPGWTDVLQPANVTRTVLFVAIGLSISVIGGRLQTSRADLALSVRRLRASNRAKDEALATLGHEIRNPLAALRSAQEVLKRAPGAQDKVEWVTGIIGRQVEQMARLADDLLDLSSITRGEAVLRRERIDLQAILRQSLDQAEPLIQKKGHRLQVAIDPQPAPVLGDPIRLVQVFTNLLTNAAKYTDPGGELTLTLARPAAHLVAVSVADNGVGMEPEAIADLFEPFVQAPGAASNAERGLGLGLAIVKTTVELHGGRVQGSSEGIGLGSVFTVTLPLSTQPA